MSINFHLRLGKKAGNKFVKVLKKKNPDFEKLYPKDLIIDPEIPDTNSGRYNSYFSLFKEFREKVESLAKEKLNFEFYGNPKHFIKPDKILHTCEKLKEIFTKYENEFPFYYAWLSDKGWWKDSRHEDHVIYKDGNICTIWFNEEDNKCYLYNNDTQEKVELKEDDKIKGCSFNYKKNLRPDEIRKNDKVTKSKSGDELIISEEEVYTIIRENVYEKYKEELEEILRLCNYAKKKGYFIQGYIC